MMPTLHTDHAPRRDTLEPFVVVVPLERSVPERPFLLRRMPDLRVPLFVLVGLPVIAACGAVIGCVLTAL